MTVIAIKGVLESLKYSSPFNEKIMQNKIDNLMISVYFLYSSTILITSLKQWSFILLQIGAFVN